MMIGTEKLEEIISTIVRTPLQGFPISCILVGPSGCGKSSLLSQFRSDESKGEHYFHFTDSITQNGLFDVCKKDEHNKIRFIVIPDFNLTLSKRQSTLEAVLGNLLTLTNDGTTRTDDGRSEKGYAHEPTGLLTTATTEMYDKYSRKFYKLGLRRRIFPIFYRYSLQTIHAIQIAVSAGKVPPGIQKRFYSVEDSGIIPKIPEKIESEIIILSTQLAVLMGKDKAFSDQSRSINWVCKEVMPISPQQALRILARANAAKHGSGEVNQDDLQFLYEFIKFCDPAHPCEL